MNSGLRLVAIIGAVLLATGGCATDEGGSSADAARPASPLLEPPAEAPPVPDKVDRPTDAPFPDDGSPSAPGTGRRPAGSQPPPGQPRNPPAGQPDPSVAPEPALTPTSRRLGGVDLERYCQEGWGMHAVLRQPNAYGWRCAADGRADRAISIDDVCRQQYGEPAARSRYGAYDDPRSWYCYVP